MYGFNSRLEWREEGLSVLANRKIEITQIEQQRGDSLGLGEEHHLKDLCHEPPVKQIPLVSLQASQVVQW